MEKKSPAYNDDDIMPWGRYSGDPLCEVPVGYLHWLWANRPLQNDPEKKLENYIHNSLAALKKEAPDLIW